MSENSRSSCEYGVLNPSTSRKRKVCSKCHQKFTEIDAPEEQRSTSSSLESPSETSVQLIWMSDFGQDDDMTCPQNPGPTRNKRRRLSSDLAENWEEHSFGSVAEDDLSISKLNDAEDDLQLESSRPIPKTLPDLDMTGNKRRRYSDLLENWEKLRSDTDIDLVDTDELPISEWDVAGKNMQTTGSHLVPKTLPDLDTTGNKRRRYSDLLENWEKLRSDTDIDLVGEDELSISELNDAGNNTLTTGSQLVPKTLPDLDTTANKRRRYSDLLENWEKLRSDTDIDLVDTDELPISELDVAGKNMQTTGSRPVPKTLPDLDSTGNKRCRYSDLLENWEKLRSDTDIDLIGEDELSISELNDAGNNMLTTGSQAVPKTLPGLDSTANKRCRYLDLLENWEKLRSDTDIDLIDKDELSISELKDAEDSMQLEGAQARKTSPANGYESKNGYNLYNGSLDKAIVKKGLRPIIIDGSNIAYSHGKNRFFSSKGIKICVDYFLRRNHRVYAFVPHFRVCARQAENRDILFKLESAGHLIFTPSRWVDNRLITPYDDRYIVQCATEFGGVIISRDNYRDLMPENPLWEETIKERLLMYTWVDDLLIFPLDPMGKKKPTLENFLRF